MDESGLVRAVEELEGMTLLCECGAAEGCHGDILLEKLRRSSTAAVNRREVAQVAGVDVRMGDVVDGLSVRLGPEPAVWVPPEECDGSQSGWSGKGPIV